MNDNRERLIAKLRENWHGTYHEKADAILADGWKLENPPKPMSPALRERIAEWLYEDTVGGNGGPGSWNNGKLGRHYSASPLTTSDFYFDAADRLIDSIAAPVAPVVLPTRKQLLDLWDAAPTSQVDSMIFTMIAAGFATEDDPEPEAVEPDFNAMTDSEVEAWMKDQVGEEGWTATRFVGTRADIPPTHGKRWAAYLTKPTDGPMTEVFEKTYSEAIRSLAKAMSAVKSKEAPE